MKVTEWLADLERQVPKDVEKYLRSKPVLPDGSALTALVKQFDSTKASYIKAYDGMNADAKNSQSLYEKAVAECKKAVANLKDETFGLNEKDKADQKKIAQARAIYADSIEEVQHTFEKRTASAKGFLKGTNTVEKTASGNMVPLA